MQGYYHSVTLDADKCMGVPIALRDAPRAIRVRDGKAYIIAERCIDCGNVSEYALIMPNCRYRSLRCYI